MSRDRDLSDMQVTLLSHTRMLEGVQQTLGQHTSALSNVEREVRSLRLEVQTGFALIGAQLATLIKRSDPGEQS